MIFVSKCCEKDFELVIFYIKTAIFYISHIFDAKYVKITHPILGRKNRKRMEEKEQIKYEAFSLFFEGKYKNICPEQICWLAYGKNKWWEEGANEVKETNEKKQRELFSVIWQCKQFIYIYIIYIIYEKL